MAGPHPARTHLDRLSPEDRRILRLETGPIAGHMEGIERSVEELLT